MAGVALARELMEKGKVFVVYDLYENIVEKD